ncbi:MAG: 23S rRNA (adenine(2503)-C(2))-methyltransferase RlmN [SAR324 cluster bacterium]|nr:23S rRNA (adenine(2503)-C(2))-methyltransferase RlmN [SAR324 cluster bacterium]
MDNIKDYTLPALTEWMAQRGEPAFRARQVFQWLYQRRVTGFEQMSNVARPLRRRLGESFSLGGMARQDVRHSRDGSVKYALRLDDGQCIEAVLMPNDTHYTLCISTQVGCAMGCDFCMTARMGLVRNLSAGEIVQQVVEAYGGVEEGGLIRNLVFMGMGEPLHNYDNLVRALTILTEDHGFGFSWRRLTVSTSGLVPAIRRFAADRLPANLAISLNAVSDETRARLMPVNRRWNIAALLDACREIPKEPRVRITFEYVLLKGITDSLADARKLVKLLHGIKCKVNLIPFNPWPGSTYEGPSLEHARAFQEELLHRGLLTTLRISKGQDIQAACGQLITASPAARWRKVAG